MGPSAAWTRWPRRACTSPAGTRLAVIGWGPGPMPMPMPMPMPPIRQVRPCRSRGRESFLLFRFAPGAFMSLPFGGGPMRRACCQPDGAARRCGRPSDVAPTTRRGQPAIDTLGVSSRSPPRLQPRQADGPEEGPLSARDLLGAHRIKGAWRWSLANPPPWRSRGRRSSLVAYRGARSARLGCLMGRIRLAGTGGGSLQFAVELCSQKDHHRGKQQPQQ
jgi:hypothetical protein